jgi:filamentous hemagglutinin family protein
MEHSVHKLLRLSWKIVMAGLVLPFSALTKAEVTLDGTLSPAGSLTGPHFVIPDTVGQTVGTNLFHSFGLFNINTGESATFTGPAAIDNVISRVTGGSQSFIDGPLRSEIQSANLWFINPAGVLFGQHASLDIQGSFHVSTADYLKLGDGGRFEATNPENSVLTVAPPEAFGFLGERQPAGIAVQGSLLQVPDGETLSVVGGDIQIADGSLYAPGGRVNMASVASAGEVRLEPNGLGMDSFNRLGRIEMNQESIIDTSGEGGGSIFIRGGQFTMDRSRVQPETRGGKNGGIVSVKARDLQMRNEADIGTSTFGAGDGGLIEVEVDSMSLSKEAIISSVSLGAGDGGPVVVRVAGHLQLKEGAGISTGPALGRAITVGGFDLTGSNIIIKAGSLQVSGRGYISASTIGTRKGGNIEIEAENIVLEGGALEEGFQEFRSSFDA